MDAVRRRTQAMRAGAMFVGASAAAALGACSSSETGAQSTPTTASNGDGTTSTTAATADQSAAFVGLKDSDELTSREYVGAVDGTDIYGAIVTSSDNATGEVEIAGAYFCDGERVANWFGLASVDGDEITLKAKSGATFVATKASDGTIDATVELDGAPRSITFTEVDAEGEAGLYLADHVIDPALTNNERAGWIVLPDGSQRGAVRGGTTVLPGGTFTASANPQVVVAGREVMLRAITHIIQMDIHS